MSTEYVDNRYKKILSEAAPQIKGEEAAPEHEDEAEQHQLHEFPPFEVSWVTRQCSHITQQPGTFLRTQPPQSEPTQPSQSDVDRSGFELLNFGGQMLEFVQLFSEEARTTILSLIKKKKKKVAMCVNILYKKN